MLNKFKQFLDDGKEKGLLMFSQVKDKPTFCRVVMACYLIGRADGDFDGDEKTATAKLIQNKFPQYDIGDIMDVIKDCDEKVSFSAAMGESEIISEIIKASGDSIDLIINAAVYIGAADGDFDDSEKAVVIKLIERMNRKKSDFGL